MAWRLWGSLIVGVALLAYVLSGTGRDAPMKEVGARDETPAPAEPLPLQRAELPGVPEERGVVEAEAEPAVEPRPPSYVTRIQEWEAATEGVLEGRLVATRGIESWKGWRVYATSRSGMPGIKVQKHVDVDATTGFFRVEELPLGEAELIWHHPVAGILEDRLEVEIESGLNTVEMRYDGPDPQASIFVSVTCDEPVAPEAIIATDGARVFWAEALAENYFAVSGLSPGFCWVKVDHPGRKMQEYQTKVGSRLRVDLD